MKTTRANLLELLQGTKGAKIVTIVTKTIPTLTGGRQCPLKGNVYKVSTVNGVINFKYENAVNNQRMREGHETPFEAQARTWSEKQNNEHGGVCIVTKGDDKQYLEIKVERSLGHKYIDNAGNEIDKAVVAPYLPVRRRESTTQEIDKQVVMRDYGMNGILQITLDGKTLDIVD